MSKLTQYSLEFIELELIVSVPVVSLENFLSVHVNRVFGEVVVVGLVICPVLLGVVGMTLIGKTLVRITLVGVPLVRVTLVGVPLIRMSLIRIALLLRWISLLLGWIALIIVSLLWIALMRRITLISLIWVHWL